MAIAIGHVMKGLRLRWSPASSASSELAVRAAIEDRTLHAELADHPGSAARVRHRLVPGVW